MEYDDILESILGWIDSGSTWKSCLWVCHRWNLLAAAVHPTGRAKFANHLWTLVRMFPGASWNCDLISADPNTSYGQLCAEKRSWNLYDILENPNISWGTIEWFIANESDVFSGVDISEGYERENLYDEISVSPSVGWSVIVKNPDAEWNWGVIFRRTPWRSLRPTGP
jgi:hypothetical protein